VGAIHSTHDTLQRAIEKLSTELVRTRNPDEIQEAKIASIMKIIEEANRVIASGTSRVTDIVRRLRSFARLDEAEMKLADIHECLEDTLALAQHELKHNVSIKRNYGDISPFACYPGRLNQVFLNILMNARQAIKTQGEISITTYRKDNHAYIEIADNGSGIPPEHLNRIFDPGFTTKGVGVGTGLGLSICYQIIRDHKGEIRVASEVGKGTKFTIALPMFLEVKKDFPPLPEDKSGLHPMS
jgi:signal transduction histidine kinase